MISSEIKTFHINYNIQLSQTLESSGVLAKGAASEISTPNEINLPEAQGLHRHKELSAGQSKSSLAKIKANFSGGMRRNNLSAAEFISILNGK